MAFVKEKNAADEKQLDLGQALRKQKRTRRRHRRIVVAVVAVFLIAYFSGVFSSLLTIGKTWQESIVISLSTQAGFPAQTGISSLYQVETLSGGFVALGEESCVVYSAGGNRLRSIQSGYIRPSIAVGGSRYLLYHRAGNELRVESRTETVYTKTYTNSILVASISQNGAVAVATESDRYLANITMYSSNMTELLSYSMTDSEGFPIRMEYSDDNKTLAVATITASEGQMCSRIFLLSSANGTATCLDTQTQTPFAIEWISSTAFFVVYENMVVWYDTASQSVVTSYEYSNKTLTDYAVYGENIALLFSYSAQSEAVLLQDDFTQITEIETDTLVSSIALDQDSMYLVYEKTIESYTMDGAYLDTTQSEKKILDLLVSDDIFLFTADEVTIFTPPTASTAQ